MGLWEPSCLGLVGGGNMIALVTQETCSRVSMMLRLAGAKDVILTEVS